MVRCRALGFAVKEKGRWSIGFADLCFTTLKIKTLIILQAVVDKVEALLELARKEGEEKRRDRTSRAGSQEVLQLVSLNESRMNGRLGRCQGGLGCAGGSQGDRRTGQLDRAIAPS